ncbi:uncharacterized protein LOC116417230 [Nasonia vitripennis]|uniref:Uncharacterized protein n=1 Tax=Nasonia vitripennis TaxID=7425 RepID=A0A7M7T9M9_NASVI|nr:uncharacterized protein LOC116417230 [Nasonia vitripennis]
MAIQANKSLSNTMFVRSICTNGIHRWRRHLPIEGIFYKRRWKGQTSWWGMGYINRHSTVKSTFEQSSLKITCLWRRNQDSLNISKMDLSALNKIAEREFLPKKKAMDLEKDHAYMVTALKEVKTRFGTKIVAMLKDQELFNNLCNTANKLSLFITYQGGTSFKFTTC